MEGPSETSQDCTQHSLQSIEEDRHKQEKVEKRKRAQREYRERQKKRKIEVPRKESHNATLQNENSSPHNFSLPGTSYEDKRQHQQQQYRDRQKTKENYTNSVEFETKCRERKRLYQREYRARKRDPENTTSQEIQTNEHYNNEKTYSPPTKTQKIISIHNDTSTSTVTHEAVQQRSALQERCAHNNYDNAIVTPTSLQMSYNKLPHIQVTNQQGTSNNIIETVAMIHATRNAVGKSNVQRNVIIPIQHTNSQFCVTNVSQIINASQAENQDNDARRISKFSATTVTEVPSNVIDKRPQPVNAHSDDEHSDDDSDNMSQINDALTDESNGSDLQEEINYPADEMDAILRSATYSNYRSHLGAHNQFKQKFTNNAFGHTCTVCERLWFKQDLKKPNPICHDLLYTVVPHCNIQQVQLCSTCKRSLDSNKIPIMATYNGFRYPLIPVDLPKLDLVTERLISPRLPFMQIRRLRHVHGQYGIYGQIINVPVNVDNMVTCLPRELDDDYCINVHIKKKHIHKTSYLRELINKKNIKLWLRHLVQSTLYKIYNIKADEFLNQDVNFNIPPITQKQQDDFTENILIEESLIAQQHTLLWNEDEYLNIAPAEHNRPESILFQENSATA